MSKSGIILLRPTKRHVRAQSTCAQSSGTNVVCDGHFIINMSSAFFHIAMVMNCYVINVSRSLNKVIKHPRHAKRYFITLVGGLQRSQQPLSPMEACPCRRSQLLALETCRSREGRYAQRACHLIFLSVPRINERYLVSFQLTYLERFARGMGEWCMSDSRNR
jgi:hypothetical protein